MRRSITGQKRLLKNWDSPYQPPGWAAAAIVTYRLCGMSLLCGLGLNGDFLHNPKEYVQIDTIPTRVALVAELIRTL